MPTITLDPNPTAPSSWITVTGTSFARTATRVLVDGTTVGLDSLKPNTVGGFSIGFQCQATEGTQLVTAQQKKSGKWTTIASATLTVQPTVPPPPPPSVPVASYTVVPTSGQAGDSFQFHDTSTGTVTTRQWDIGAGTFRPTEKDPLIVIPAPDTWHVVLTVGNSAGSDTATGTIEVTSGTPPPPPPPPPSGINVPATAGALKTAVAGAHSGDIFIPAAGTHTYTTTLGQAYTGVKVYPSVDNVVINGPGAILSPSGLADGVDILADGTQLLGSQASPLEVRANPAGPTSDANGSGLINITGLSQWVGADSPTSNVLIQDVILRGAPIMNVAQHLVYASGRLLNITMRRVQLIANGSKGFGFHDYHADAGASPSDNYLFEDCVFDGFGSGGKSPVILWNNVNNVTFRRCVFKNTSGVGYDIRVDMNGTLRLESCTFSTSQKVFNEGGASTIVIYS